MPLDVLQTLRELIAIPSVNPMGRDVAGPEYLETRLTDHLERLFDRLGLRHHRQAVAPGRDNILCRIEGRSDRLLLLEAHQDTVPVDGMTIPPFEPTVSDARVYGRGACDVKGGMAAMLAAVARLAEERPAEMPTVVLACTINEEFGFSGATRLVEGWRADDPLLPRRPDMALVAEPTLLNVVVAHKGTVRWKCAARGVAGHSSQPRLAQNAIYAAGRVALAVERYQNEVLENRPAHPLCGRPTACATMIEAGISVNTIPDHCRMEIERRLLPDEDPDAAYREALDHIARHVSPGDQIEHEPPYVVARGLSDGDNGALAEQLRRAALPFATDCALVGVPYGTDAAVYSAAGVPAVVFGPGSIDQAHRADEWLAVEQLEKASEALYRFSRQA